MNATARPYRLPGHRVLPEPRLRFGSNDLRDVDIHPMRGLLRFGPYSKGKLAPVSDPIRIAIIAPSDQTEQVLGLIRELEHAHVPRERKAYLPNFPGFERVFGIRLARARGATTLELPSTLTDEMERSERPHLILASALTRSLLALRNACFEFDIVLILLVEEWQAGFQGQPEEDFDLHHYIKAYAASEGICVQIIRESKALNYSCRCSVAWRLGIALYTKAGGVPWVLADIDHGTAFIGIDYALRAGAEDARFAICCSQVFDAEGSGLEFVAYEAEGVHMFGRNPFLRRDQMLKVMARSLAIYQRKHVGDPPRRIVVHKDTEFRKDEIEGVFDAFPNAEDIELIHVQQQCGWRGVLISAPQQPHGYPCHRGSVLQLGSQEILVWSQGNLPAITAGGKDYFKEGKGVPEPLLLTRYAGLSTMEDVAKETLSLTKMDWNNDGPYDRLPVTLNFAGTLSKIVRRIPKLEPYSYPVRLFM
jgi:hypothetical protein